MEISKHIESYLMQVASQLPEVIYNKYYIENGEKILIVFKLKTAEDFEKKFKVKYYPKGKYRIKMKGNKEAVNHFKRLRSAFIGNGIDGVNEYIKKYETINQ